MAKLAVFRPSHKQPFIARLVAPGETLVSGKEALVASVEFYDGSHGATPIIGDEEVLSGQFTGTCITLSSLVKSSGPLKLHADKKDWLLDPTTMNEVRTWLGALALLNKEYAS